MHTRSLVKPGWFIAVAVACLLSSMSLVSGATLGETDMRGFPLPAGSEIWSARDRDDYEAGELHVSTEPGLICRLGGRSARYPQAAAACLAARDETLDQRDAVQALRQSAQ